MTDATRRNSSLERLADIAHRRRWPIVIGALVVLAALAVVAAGRSRRSC